MDENATTSNYDITKQPQKIQMQEADKPTTSAETLRALYQDGKAYWQIRLSIGQNPNVPEDIKERIIRDGDDRVSSYFREQEQNKKIEKIKFQLDFIATKKQSISNHEMSDARRELRLIYKEIDFHIEDELDDQVRKEIAILEVGVSPSASPTISENTELCLALAKDPETSTDILEQLSKDRWDIRLEVAQNPSTPASALERLADDRDDDVRWRVAKHHNTSTSTLEQLAKNQYFYTRCCVAENPNTPTSVLQELAEDKDERVRELVEKKLTAPSASSLSDTPTISQAPVSPNYSSGVCSRCHRQSQKLIGGLGPSCARKAGLSH